MIHLRTLDNGVRIATDSMDSVRSCSVGLWIEFGSRWEGPREYGITHFIEHMFFKGTGRFTALELAAELNRLGGQFNAHTGQEAMCLHAQCVDAKTPEVLELLCEMLLESTFAEDEIRRERNVVLEEYRMYEDNPEDRVYDLYYRALWPKSGLGRPILGSKASIGRLSRPAIRRYMDREFEPRRILIALAGSFDGAACSRVIRRKLGAIPRRRRPRRADPSIPGAERVIFEPRELGQMHFCLGTLGPRRTSPDRYAFGLLNMMLGGGMSSRLFNEVREKRGLAYSIQSFAQTFRDTGGFGIAGSTSPENFEQVIELCLGELSRACAERASDEELDLVKEQIVDSILMSVESTSSRMTRLSEAILTTGRVIPYRTIIERVRATGPSDLRRVARKYFSGRRLVGALIGPEGTSTRALRRRI